MKEWHGLALGAALLYGLHQVFTRAASRSISDGLGSLLVETTAALTIGVCLAFLRGTGRWNQTADAWGIFYSIMTGLCVGAGTLLFFLMFQRKAPLSAVPVVLAVGSAVMALAGWTLFREPVTWKGVLGLLLSLAALLLLRGK